MPGLDISMVATHQAKLCRAVRQWVATVPTLTREATVTCFGHNVIVDTLHTPG